jgi:hypothetical protein
MQTLEDKVAELDVAHTHMIAAFRILEQNGYRGLANAMLELIDEVSTEIGDIDLDIYDSEYDGQPDEAQEWHDFDPDC